MNRKSIPADDAMSAAPIHALLWGDCLRIAARAHLRYVEFTAHDAGP
jgi:hypothetical protein